MKGSHQQPPLLTFHGGGHIRRAEGFVEPGYGYWLNGRAVGALDLQFKAAGAGAEPAQDGGVVVSRPVKQQCQSLVDCGPQVVDLGERHALAERDGSRAHAHDASVGRGGRHRQDDLVDCERFAHRAKTATDSVGSLVLHMERLTAGRR